MKSRRADLFYAPSDTQEKGQLKEMYAYDAFTIPSNLAGNCAAVINIGKIENVPVGLQVICPSFKESLMFNVLHKFEMLK